MLKVTLSFITCAVLQCNKSTFTGVLYSLYLSGFILFNFIRLYTLLHYIYLTALVTSLCQDYNILTQYYLHYLRKFYFRFYFIPGFNGRFHRILMYIKQGLKVELTDFISVLICFSSFQRSNVLKSNNTFQH